MSSVLLAKHQVDTPHAYIHTSGKTTLSNSSFAQQQINAQHTQIQASAVSQTLAPFRSYTHNPNTQKLPNRFAHSHKVKHKAKTNTQFQPYTSIQNTRTFKQIQTKPPAVISSSASIARPQTLPENSHIHNEVNAHISNTKQFLPTTLINRTQTQSESLLITITNTEEPNTITEKQSVQFSTVKNKNTSFEQ